MISPDARLCRTCGYGISPKEDKCSKCGATYVIYENKPECFTRMANVSDTTKCIKCSDFSVCWKIAYLHVKKGVQSSLRLVQSGFRYL